MSLINQMLRDLEQRNNPTSNTTQALDVRIAARPAGKSRSSRLWLLALMVIALAYYWHQDQANQPPAPLTAASSEPHTADTTASADPNQNPPTASVPLTERSSSGQTATAMVLAANASPAESQKPTVSQLQDHEPLKPAEQPQANAQKPAIMPSPPELNSSSPALSPVEKTKPSKPPTPGEQAEALYRQAQRSASVLMKKANLEEALQLDPRHLPARTLLLQTLMQSHAGAELSEFADESLALFPRNLLFIKTRAHLYIQQKNFTGAVSLLERIDAGTVDDSAYLALLAAGYQQLQRFPQAAEVYQQLSQIQPEKAENWLGLAIAQDRLNQHHAATQSYRQALDKKTLNAEVVSYINQRLSALTQ